MFGPPTNGQTNSVRYQLGVDSCVYVPIQICVKNDLQIVYQIHAIDTIGHDSIRLHTALLHAVICRPRLPCSEPTKSRSIRWVRMIQAHYLKCLELVYPRSIRWGPVIQAYELKSLELVFYLRSIRWRHVIQAHYLKHLQLVYSCSVRWRHLIHAHYLKYLEKGFSSRNTSTRANVVEVLQVVGMDHV